MAELEDAIKEIRELAKAFRERNGNSLLRIPNKDFNLWIVKEFIDQRGEIIKLKTKVKMLMFFMTISIPVLLLLIKVA